MRGNLPLLLLCLGVSAAVLWPLPCSPHPHDHGDTLFNSWLIAWNHHALSQLQNPLETPQFSGFPDSNGRSDILLTQWIASLPLRVVTGNPVRIHNLLMWLSLALTGFAAGVFAKDMGASAWGAAFAGTAFIALPYFQGHLWHLQLQSAGLAIAGIMFALRAAGGRSSGWPLVAIIPLQGLASLYHWYFLNIALLVILLSTLATGNRTNAKRLLLTAFLGNCLMLPFLVPQLQNAARWDINTITSTDISSFASPWDKSFATGWLRSPHAHPEAALWPGIALVAGSIWALLKKDTGNTKTILAIGLVFLVYSLGPTVTAWGRQLCPGPFRLIALLPGGAALRLPARAAFLAFLPLLVAAARQLGKKRVWALAGMAVALTEAAHPGITTVPVVIPEHHYWIAGQQPERVLYLPVNEELDLPAPEAMRLYCGTLHFTPSVNGYSTSYPGDYPETAAILNSWPSSGARELAFRLGVDLVIFEQGVPDGVDMQWFDGRIRTGAVWLDR
jgi:hypothetical protein